MKASDKYIRVFGRIDTLAEQTPWTTGVSNVLEWLVWGTSNVLGISKTQYQKKIAEWAFHGSQNGESLEAIQNTISTKIKSEINNGERANRHDRPSSTLASPREALRRAKFFSEDYLNKEFDIFWGLSSDSYLDSFYSQFTTIQGDSSWYSHGNSGLFANSTAIGAMQMDNLSYNPNEKLLIANELKLGGKKNKDQILKYALMFKLLKERGFIAKQSRFLLLFIGDKLEPSNWKDIIDNEIEHCQDSTKSTARLAIKPDVVGLARSAEYAATTWSDLLEFNDLRLDALDGRTQQVEIKLIKGFNEALASKFFMQSRQSH